MKCVSEIIQRLLAEVDAGGDVDLNDIKREATQKYKVCDVFPRHQLVCTCSL